MYLEKNIICMPKYIIINIFCNKYEIYPHYICVSFWNLQESYIKNISSEKFCIYLLYTYTYSISVCSACISASKYLISSKYMYLWYTIFKLFFFYNIVFNSHGYPIFFCAEFVCSPTFICFEFIECIFFTRLYR